MKDAARYTTSWHYFYLRGTANIFEAMIRKEGYILPLVIYFPQENSGIISNNSGIMGK